MIVSHILEAKGHEVATISPDATVSDAVQVLGTRRIGALVVTDDGRKILGIISERDVVKHLAQSGASALNDAVSKHMTAKVVTCERNDPILAVVEQMTVGRFRHMPVADEGKLVGIVSIGDVVKARLEQMARESEALREYITN